MKIRKNKLFGSLVIAVFTLFGFASAFAQDKDVVKCKVKDKELKAVKYFVGRVERVEDTLAVDIGVKPAQINETDLVLIAKHLKARFCNEAKLVVGIFDNNETPKRFDSSFQSAIDALRGEYVLDREKGEDYISFVKVPDYNNHFKDRIRIDLNKPK